MSKDIFRSGGWILPTIHRKEFAKSLNIDYDKLKKYVWILFEDDIKIVNKDGKTIRSIKLK